MATTIKGGKFEQIAEALVRAYYVGCQEAAKDPRRCKRILVDLMRCKRILVDLMMSMDITLDGSTDRCAQEQARVMVELMIDAAILKVF